MSALIPQNFGPVSSVFAGHNANDDLSSGISSSYGLIGYKGKVWSIRYRGEDTPLMREDGDGAKGSIEVVILAASKAISKVWYEAGYVEGSVAAPDCFSNNGVTPDIASTKKQCDTCALCPHNQWGSRQTTTGGKGKACSDSKRLAVAPIQDLYNEVYGGPMLLRVPAASLQDLAQYGTKMNQLGYPYYSIATRIAFDPAESYPKFVFNAIRPLTNEEGQIVVETRTGHQIERVLSENEFGAAPPPAQPDTSSAFEQPPETQASSTQASANVTTQGNSQAGVDVAAEAEAAKKAAAAKKRAETLAAKKAELAAAEKEAAEAERLAAEQAAAAAAQPEESDEDRELRELEEAIAARRAKKAEAAAGTASTSNAAAATGTSSSPSQGQAASSAAGQTAQTTASHIEENLSTGSDFEADLDAMLDNLMPA